MRPENSLVLGPETGAPLEFPVGGASRHSSPDQTTPPAVHFAWTLPIADLFPRQSPAHHATGLMLCLRAPTAAEILKGILH